MLKSNISYNMLYLMSVYQLIEPLTLLLVDILPYGISIRPKTCGVISFSMKGIEILVYMYIKKYLQNAIDITLTLTE